MAESVVIPRRFRGPPDSANGGYACGSLAKFVDGAAVEVTLRAPPPLDVPLEVEHGDAGVDMRDGETVVAAARAVEPLEIELPDPIDLETASETRRDAPTEDHPFPGCFVCGPDRGPGDGLCVVCGPVPGRESELVGSVLESEDWATDGGLVAPEIVWGALDCPSGIAGTVVPTRGLYVLGRLTTQLLKPIEAGPEYPVVGWPIGEEGRKFESASAILDPGGEPLALARATWIRIKEAE